MAESLSSLLQELLKRILSLIALDALMQKDPRMKTQPRMIMSCATIELKSPNQFKERLKSTKLQTVLYRLFVILLPLYCSVLILRSAECDLYLCYKLRFPWPLQPYNT